MTGFSADLGNVIAGSVDKRSLIGHTSSVVSSAEENANDVGSSIKDGSEHIGNTASGAIQSAASAAKELPKIAQNELAEVESNIAEFYLIGLLGYCKGKYSEANSVITKCSSPSAGFWFNFTEVLGLETTWAEKLFPIRDSKGGNSIS